MQSLATHSKLWIKATNIVGMRRENANGIVSMKRHLGEHHLRIAGVAVWRTAITHCSRGMSAGTRLLLTFMGVSVALAMSPPLAARAAIYTWNGCGADGNWNTPGNWAGDLQPSASDSLLFTGCVRTTNSNNIASGKFAGISYDTSAGAFLTTGNSLALNGNLTDSSTAAETLNLAISVSGASTIIVANGGRLLFGSTATSNPYNVDPGGTTATFAGATAGSGEIDAHIFKPEECEHYFCACGYDTG